MPVEQSRVRAKHPPGAEAIEKNILLEPSFLLATSAVGGDVCVVILLEHYD